MRASESSEYEKIFDALDLALLRFITTSKSSSIGTPLYRPKHFGMSESAAYESLRYKLEEVLRILTSSPA